MGGGGGGVGLDPIRDRTLSEEAEEEEEEGDGDGGGGNPPRADEGANWGGGKTPGQSGGGECMMLTHCSIIYYVCVYFCMSFDWLVCSLFFSRQMVAMEMEGSPT